MYGGTLHYWSSQRDHWLLAKTWGMCWCIERTAPLLWFWDHIGSFPLSGISRIFSWEWILVWEPFESPGYTTRQSTPFPLQNMYMGFDFQYPRRFDIKEISASVRPIRKWHSALGGRILTLAMPKWCPQSLKLSLWDDLRNTDNTFVPRDRD